MNRVAGEITLRLREPDDPKAQAYLERRFRGRPPTTSQILGTPRRNEHGATLARPGQTAATRELLAPIYGWFTEGFDTRDLKEAKALLDRLAASS